MGIDPAPQPAETLVQLVLRARGEVLVQSSEDWRSLGLIVARMLFWHGGAVYACRCEGREMRFALQVLHASTGAIAHQITAAYATRLRKTRGLKGPLFQHYQVIPQDEVFLEELVFWLHRPQDLAGADSPLRTAESAYLMPSSLPWIASDRVLGSLSVGAPGAATYRRRKSEPISPDVLDSLTRRPKGASAHMGYRSIRARPGIEMLARAVAEHCQISYEEMLTHTRKRSVSRARAIAAVLATRNGVAAAETARLFNRSRSSLIEQVEYYRARQPGLFAAAESQLEARIREARE
jgi:hypothetical protein